MANNGYDAPKGFCDRHGVGYTKSIGCLDCNALKAESKTKETTKIVNDVVSTRVFPYDELINMIDQDKLSRCVGVDKIVLSNKAYIFVSKANSNLLYFKLNERQAIEITINVEKVE